MLRVNYSLEFEQFAPENKVSQKDPSNLPIIIFAGASCCRGKLLNFGGCFRSDPIKFNLFSLKSWQIFGIHPKVRPCRFGGVSNVTH